MSLASQFCLAAQVEREMHAQTGRIALDHGVDQVRERRTAAEGEVVALGPVRRHWRAMLGRQALRSMRQRDGAQAGGVDDLS